MLPPFAHPAFQGRFGVARRDISPPAGIYSRNWGAAEKDVATSLHQPLLLTVLAIDEEENTGTGPLALLSLDLGWWRSAEEEAYLNAAVVAAGIAPGRYILALSHTHAGPVFCPGESGKPGGEWIAPYLEQLGEAIRSAVAEAIASMQAGVLEVATGACGLATNRDLPEPDGMKKGRPLVGWNPAVEADGTVLVGRVTTAGGAPLATIVNYACHPTILAWGNETISPDYIGAMREVVEGAVPAPCLFLQGASGELAARHQYVGELAVAERAGRSLGHAVLGVLFGMLPPGEELAYRGALQSGAPLAIWETQPRTARPGSLTVQQLPFDLPIRADLASEAELQQEIALCGDQDRVEAERLRRRLLLRRSLGDGASFTTTHLLWRLGEVLFVTAANECYSIFQRTLRESAGAAPLFVATLANGSRGYLAPLESYREQNYAAWQSPFAEGSLEQTIAALQPEVAGAAARCF